VANDIHRPGTGLQPGTWDMVWVMAHMPAQAGGAQRAGQVLMRKLAHRFSGRPYTGHQAGELDGLQGWLPQGPGVWRLCHRSCSPRMTIHALHQKAFHAHGAKESL
jgi:hypothetical protein